MTAPSTLLIDDESGVLDSIRNLFERHGLAVDSAATWDEGLELFRVGLHELVIADYNLPGSRHGLRLLSEARSLHPSTEVALISGSLPEEAGELAQRAGLIDHFFVKTSDLPETLLRLAAAARDRAVGPSNWPSMARAFLSQRRVDHSALERVDQMLRRHLPTE